MRLQQASAHPAVFDCDRAAHPAVRLGQAPVPASVGLDRDACQKRFHSCAALPFSVRRTAKPTTKTVRSSCLPQKWQSQAADIVVFACSSIT